jgi:hypothetical protein
MTFETIDTLHSICGGQQAAQPVSPQPSVEDRARAAAREEFDLEERSRENDEFREWEKRHPFGALICQGDRSCMR